MLYSRQILILLVNLYTVRIVLSALGAEDYGIYSVVGGLVTLFTFLNNAMTNTTQRFLNFALGQNDTEQVRNIYSISFIIYIAIALFVILLAATIGLWFIINSLNIPPNRLTAALFVYLISVLTTVINILRIPYNATISSYEKFSFVAFIGTIECAFKLIIALILPIFMLDKLILYAFLVSISAVVIFFVYKFYCNKTFETAHFRYCNDKKLLRQLVNFSGWTVLGSLAGISSTHGVNILINIFHGVIVNAASGIAAQVNSAVNSFVLNFQTAFKPQIIKSYAAKDYNYFNRLIFQTSKISFFLLIIIVLPLYINTDFVLRIWLTNVPEYSIIFIQIRLINSLITSIENPLRTAINAIGDIKKYQLVSTFFYFANLPLSFISLSIGLNPAWVFIILIGLNVFSTIWIVHFLVKKINFSLVGFFTEVILPVLIISAACILIAIFFHHFFVDWSKLILSGIVSVIGIGGLVYLIGLNAKEKALLHNWFKNKLRH